LPPWPTGLPDGTTQSGRSGAGSGSGEASGGAPQGPSNPQAAAAACPAANPSARQSASAKRPRAAPADRSAWTDGPVTKAAIAGSQRSLPRDCEKRCTVGFQPPAMPIASQSMVRAAPATSSPALVSDITRAAVTRTVPSVPTTAWPASTSMPRASAAAAGGPSAVGRRSTIAATPPPASSKSSAAG
jgi:hypothetical protein